MDARSFSAPALDESTPGARWAAATDLLSPVQLWQIYRRRKAMFFGLMALVMLLATLLIFLVTPKYTGEASVLIDPRRQQIVNIEAVVSDLQADEPTIESEIEVIRSRGLAERLIDQVHLDDYTEFNPYSDAGASGHSFFGFLRGVLPKGWIEAASGRSQLAGPEEGAAAQIARAKVVERFQEALRVTPVGRSHVIRIAFTSENRDLAAEVANTLAQLYVDAQVEAKLAATRRAAEWLEARVKDLRAKVEQAETAVETFRSEKGLFQGEASSAIAQQIAELRSQLLLAKIDLAVEKARQAGKGGQTGMAEARIQALSDTLGALVAQVARANQDEVRLRALEREAAAERSLLELFLNRSKQTEQSGLEQPDARVISRASIPTEPSFPRKIPSLVLALFFALAVSASAVVAIEAFESGFRTGDQIEGELGLPVLGAVPRPEKPGWAKEGPPLQNYVLAKPLSRHAEALRSIHTALLFQRPKSDKAHVVLVTSAMPGEGKSTFVCALARVLAKAGHRVLAADCDFHNPSLHKLFGVGAEHQRIVSSASGERFAVVVQRDDASGVEILPAAKRDASQQIVISDRLKSGIDALRSQYDIILVDTPPVLLFADASELAQLSDHCVLVVQWLETNRAAVRHAVKALARADARIAGAIMTKVDLRRYSNYDYGGGPYGQGEYGKYYRE